MKKVSIVVPNYNSARFIVECLDSIALQDYSNKEIIIVDDGSTDNSISLIQEYIQNHSDHDIRLICQKNLNAAIARNRGLDIATGDYILFIDSDDVLEKDAIKKMVNYYNKENVDLVLGGFVEISEEGAIISDRNVITKKSLKITKNDFEYLCGLKPVPANKLYRLDIIRENNLSWGNVRIGQDLNFYLKYLSLCKKVLLVNDNVFRYRIVSNSMSRTYDFRIFDIVNGFDDIKKYYEKNGNGDLYDRFIPLYALKHFGFQMNKQVNFGNYKTRKLIVDYFRVCEKKINYSKCISKKELKKARLKFRVKQFFWPFYVSNTFSSFVKRKKRKNNA